MKNNIPQEEILAVIFTEKNEERTRFFRTYEEIQKFIQKEYKKEVSLFFIENIFKQFNPSYI